MRLVLIRHGETDLNARNQFQARIDAPLNATGVRRIQAIGRTLDRDKWSAVFSSTLDRARNTADLLALATEASRHTLDELVERDLGAIDGMDKTDYAVRYPQDWARLRTDDDYAPPGGETMRAALVRFSQGLARIARADVHEPGKAVLVVTHGGVLTILARHLLDRSGDLIGNGRAISVRLGRSGATLAASVHHCDVEPNACEGDWPDYSPTPARVLPIPGTVLARV